MRKRAAYYLYFYSMFIVNVPVLLYGLYLKSLGYFQNIREEDSHKKLFAFYCRAIRFVHYVFLKKISILNEAHYEGVFFQKQYLYAPNHQSVDGYMNCLGCSEKSKHKQQPICSLVKGYTRFLPIIGWVWMMLDFGFVVKGSNTVRITCSKLMRKPYLSLGIFPEGTRSDAGVFQREKIKNGVFEISLQSKIPILPIYHNLGSAVRDKSQELWGDREVFIYIGSEISPWRSPDELKDVEALKKEYIDQMLSIEATFFSKQ